MADSLIENADITVGAPSFDLGAQSIVDVINDLTLKFVNAKKESMTIFFLVVLFGFAGWYAWRLQ